ncbi:hypothetical protein LCGC14_0560150 [marine sediment metagenome]|uniref:Uncharacterized protein n=1 Tax=marine sediment metagenome TaxID=412755 RepID=A0A0F9UVH5_9ZZZZ
MVENENSEGMKKKICLYCDEEIYYKDGSASYIDNYGRGIFCVLCGAFIEVPEVYIKSVKTSVSRSKSRYAYKRRKGRMIRVVMIILVVILIIPISYLLIPYVGFEFEDTSRKESTFQLISNETGYDMSAEVRMSIWERKVNVKFEDEDDYNNHSSYQLLVYSEFPVNIMIDLRSFDYLEVEINTNDYPNYTHYYYVIYGGINYNYVFWVKYIGNGELSEETFN